MKESIFVTKSFLPPKDEFNKYIDKIWDSSILTNNGPLLLSFEQKVRKYLNVPNFQFVTNGTLALQLAISGLGLGGHDEIITTAFSYVATTSTILWQNCTPVFVDIDPETLCIDPNKIESAITSKTKAIMAVHVFGNACDVEKIEKIAKKHNLKVIYDAAHAFGSKYKNSSLLAYGDVSTVSFHATKLFHTIEGGGIICKDKVVDETIDLQKRFGHHYDEHMMVGINAKASEFQAAMGLVNLEHIDAIVKKRKALCEYYDRLIGDLIERPKLMSNLEYNYAYYPVIFKNEQQLLDVFASLGKEMIFPRRYFYPSLDTLPYTSGNCPVSRDISSRIACLPLYVGLDEEIIKKITSIIIGIVK